MSDMPLSENTVAHRIMIARMDKRMSQRELATALGCTAPAICHWELGKNQPSVSRIRDLSVALDVSESWLAFGTGSMR